MLERDITFTKLFLKVLKKANDVMHFIKRYEDDKPSPDNSKVLKLELQDENMDIESPDNGEALKLELQDEDMDIESSDKIMYDEEIIVIASMAYDLNEILEDNKKGITQLTLSYQDLSIILYLIEYRREEIEQFCNQQTETHNKPSFTEIFNNLSSHRTKKDDKEQIEEQIEKIEPSKPCPHLSGSKMFSVIRGSSDNLNNNTLYTDDEDDEGLPMTQPVSPSSPISLTASG